MRESLSHHCTFWFRFRSERKGAGMSEENTEKRFERKLLEMEKGWYGKGRIDIAE
jgi:hypothetical protein